MCPLLDLLTRPYWSRAWILQEVILAPEAIFRCGHHKLKREDMPPLAVLVSWLGNVVDLFLTSEENVPVLLDLVNAPLRHLQGFGKAFDARKEGRLQNLANGDFKSLTMQRTSLAHDHIYTFLGFLDPKLAKQVVPDYSEDAAVSFRKFAFAWMVFRGKADLLEDAVGLRSNTLGLQSWVPDFTETQDGISPTGRYFDVNEQVQPDLEMTSDGLLGVKAFCLDVLVATSPVYPGGSSKARLAEASLESSTDHRDRRRLLGLSEAPNNDNKYVRGGTLEEAYWRTLARDRYQRQMNDRLILWLLDEHVDACRRWFADTRQHPPTAPSPVDKEHVMNYDARLTQLKGAHIFRIARGYIGVTDSTIPLQVGDRVFLIATTGTAIILRPVSSAKRKGVHNLVSGAYVHGVMLRSVLDDEATEELPAIDFRTCKHPHMLLADSWEKIWLA